MGARGNITDDEIDSVYTLRRLIEEHPEFADLPIVVMDGHDHIPIWNDGWFYTHGGDKLRKEVEEDGQDWDRYCAEDDVLGGRKRLVFSID